MSQQQKPTTRTQREIGVILIGFSLGFFANTWLLAWEKISGELPIDYWIKLFIFVNGLGGSILFLIIYQLFFGEQTILDNSD